MPQTFFLLSSSGSAFLPSFALAEGEIRYATDGHRRHLVQQRIVDGDRISFIVQRRVLCCSSSQSGTCDTKSAVDELCYCVSPA